jgi:hypothetical protein
MLKIKSNDRFAEMANIDDWLDKFRLAIAAKPN